MSKVKKMDSMPDRKDDSVRPDTLPLTAAASHPTLFRNRRERGHGFAVIAPPVMEDAHNVAEVMLHFIHGAVMKCAMVVTALDKKRQRRRKLKEKAEFPAHHR